MWNERIAGRLTDLDLAREFRAERTNWVQADSGNTVTKQWPAAAMVQ